MTIFEFENYKDFVQKRVLQMPHRGRGEFRKMALHLEVNSTVISQIFRGPRDLSPEQAVRLAQFLGLNPLESKYFINLILRERAGTHDLKNHFTRELEKIKDEAKEVKTRVVAHKELSDEQKAIYYSNWYYSGVRMLSSVPGYKTVDEISEYLGLSRSIVGQVVEFLLQSGLCTEKGGQLQVGPPSTHIGPRSPLVNNHHRNWRMKALEELNEPKEKDLFFSSPVSLSKEDKEVIREELLAVISKISKRVEKSPEETVACLNIDWFGF